MLHEPGGEANTDFVYVQIFGQIAERWDPAVKADRVDKIVSNSDFYIRFVGGHKPKAGNGGEGVPHPMPGGYPPSSSSPVIHPAISYH